MDLQARAAAFERRVYRAVRPLFLAEGKRIPSLEGCCVLLRIRDRRFLLTAAHVLDRFRGQPVSIMSPPRFAGIRGVMHFANPRHRGNRDGDHVDAAVYAIDPGFEPTELRGHYLTVRDLDVHNVSWPQDMYVTLGFPHSRSKRMIGKAVAPDWCCLYADVANEPAYRSFGLDRRTHVLLDFNHAGARAIVNGREVSAPALHGMSGCGMWRVPGIQNPRASKRDKLTAIFTAYHKRERVLTGTHVTAHLELIRAHYPELTRHIPRSRSWLLTVTTLSTVDRK